MGPKKRARTKKSASSQSATVGENTICLPLHKSSLYLFYNDITSYSSLYKIDLLEDDFRATDLLPTSENLKLFDPRNYVTGMTCALLGSKLYFLGGQLQIFEDDDHHPDYDQIFPRHVYEFDTTTDGPLKKMEASSSLNTGKPEPCVFAAAGKIYALGSRMTDQNFSDPVQLKVEEWTKELKLFECFDPFTKQWQHLPDPPTNELVRWTGCNVLEHRKEVVLAGCDFGKHTWTVLVYNLLQPNWTCYDNPGTYKIMTALSIQEGDIHGHLVYGLPADRAPVITKLNWDTMLCDCNIKSRDDDDGFVEMSVPGRGKRQLVDIFIKRHYFDYLDTAKRLLCYLGDGHFCYIDSGQFSRGHDRYGDPIRSLDSRGITITLCKDISDGDANVDGNTSTKSGGDYFKAKILRSRKLIIKTPLAESLATLEKCFVV